MGFKVLCIFVFWTQLGLSAVHVERHRLTGIHFLRCISQHCYLEHIKEKVALDIFLMTLILNLHCNHLSYHPSFKLSFSLYAYMHPRLFNMCFINASYPFFTI